MDTAGGGLVSRLATWGLAAVVGLGALGGAWPSDAATTTAFGRFGWITIPGSGTSGPADPYPSWAPVSGLTGFVTRVRVFLWGLSHTRPDDLDIFLGAPNGRNVMLMSDAGGVDDVSSIILYFDDCAPSSLPFDAPLWDWTYRPTNHRADADVMPGGTMNGLAGLVGLPA